MKSTESHIEKIRESLCQLAKAKAEHIAYFKHGGTVKDFKPQALIIARPF